MGLRRRAWFCRKIHWLSMCVVEASVPVRVTLSRFHDPEQVCVPAGPGRCQTVPLPLSATRRCHPEGRELRTDLLAISCGQPHVVSSVHSQDLGHRCLVDSCAGVGPAPDAVIVLILAPGSGSVRRAGWYRTSAAGLGGRCTGAATPAHRPAPATPVRWCRTCATDRRDRGRREVRSDRSSLGGGVLRAAKVSDVGLGLSRWQVGQIGRVDLHLGTGEGVGVDDDRP